MSELRETLLAKNTWTLVSEESTEFQVVSQKQVLYTESESLPMGLTLQETTVSYKWAAPHVLYRFNKKTDTNLYMFSPDVPAVISDGSNDNSISKSDQSTAFDDFFFTQAIGDPTTLTAGKTFDPEVPDYNVEVASIASISIGDTIFIFTGPSGEGRFYRAEVLGIIVLELELDRPIDFSFEAGDVLVSATKELNVDGSVTPQIFEIRAGGPTSTLEFDITRILMQNLSDTAVDLSKFGDIVGGLTRGIQLRHKLSATEYKNKWNIKKNADFSLLGYDWQPYDAQNQVQGQYGFGWRFTINGDDKHGVVIRIGANRSVQLIIQDNLTSLALLEMVGANHEVLN